MEGSGTETQAAAPVAPASSDMSTSLGNANSTNEVAFALDPALSALATPAATTGTAAAPADDRPAAVISDAAASNAQSEAAPTSGQPVESVLLTSGVPAGTLDATATNAAHEAAHVARAEQQSAAEEAILAADSEASNTKLEETASSSSEHIITSSKPQPLSFPPGQSPFATPVARGTPPSPSSTSALSSVTVSAAPSVAAATKDDNSIANSKETSQSPALASASLVEQSDRKPRSAGSRSTARRAASSANLRDSAAASKDAGHGKEGTAPPPSPSAKRSEKPASTSSNSSSRKRASSAQVQQQQQQQQQSQQPARQSSRSKTSATPVASTSSSNTRPRIRQRPSAVDLTTDSSANGGPATRRSRRTRQLPVGESRDAGEEEEESDDADEGTTRCICGKNDDESSAFMIQCETCKAWQHGPCVGFKQEEDCPDTYYCEQCRPDLHPNLTSRNKPKHGRSASTSSRAAITTVKEEARDDATSHPSPRLASAKPASRDARDNSSNSVPPHSATSTTHPSYHRARSSADAAIISSFLEAKAVSHSPSVPSPRVTPDAHHHGDDDEDDDEEDEDGSKRPMYPPTSHFSAPVHARRRSTMNSRESAAFDESIFLANQNAIRESKLMAMELGLGSKRKRKKRDDDEMEAVKEEEEDALEEHQELEDHAVLQGRPNGKGQQHNGSAAGPNGQNAKNGRIDTTEGEDVQEVDNTLDQTTEADEDALEDDTGNGTSTSTGSRKRRKRRGAGAMFTAPGKKKNVGSKTKKAANNVLEDAQVEEPPLSSASVEVTVSGLEDDAVGRKRKRDGQDDREADSQQSNGSPSLDPQTAQSQSHIDKAATQANKRRKGSPHAESLADDAINGEDPSLSTVPTIAYHMSGPGIAGRQFNVPTSTEASNAPSPTGSVEPSQLSKLDSTQQGHADAVTNGLLDVVVADKAAKETENSVDEDDAVSASHQEDNATTTGVNGKTARQPNQHTYKGRGGPGSRGGMKGSPSKRAALAAAAEARYGRQRDDTPSTYEDWINQPPSWGIPDHLSHLAHLLPSQSPLPLQVPKYVTSPANSAAASPITPQIENGSSGSQQASNSNPATPTILTTNSFEPSAKIRFPSRRMSVAEMRKRAKLMLDYLARVQVDMADRSSRRRALATLQEASISSAEKETSEAAIIPPSSMMFGVDSPLTPQSTAMLDDLSRQLNSFQEKFL